MFKQQLDDFCVGRQALLHSKWNIVAFSFRCCRLNSLTCRKMCCWRNALQGCYLQDFWSQLTVQTVNMSVSMLVQVCSRGTFRLLIESVASFMSLLRLGEAIFVTSYLRRNCSHDQLVLPLISFGFVMDGWRYDAVVFARFSSPNDRVMV